LFWKDRKQKELSSTNKYQAKQEDYIQEMHIYKHDYKSLSEDILEAIRSIYENLNNENLLKRYLGGFIQNNNELLNTLI